MNQVFSLLSIVLTICTKQNVGNAIVYYGMLLQYSRRSYWIFALPRKRLSDTQYASLISRSSYIYICTIRAAFASDFITITICKCYRI